METKREKKIGLGRRLCAWVLTAAMVLTLLPGWVQPAQASYMDDYLNQMVSWGFMRGDIEGNLYPDNNITRAEFVTIINRAFGYQEMGGTPFQDVDETDWFAQDVDIAYTAGYIEGTSKNTFSPDMEISREQAAVILARNLMMQPAVGENVAFSDGRELSSWSSGLVATAASYHLISGYPDGTFRPQNPITRGEAAIMVVNAIGTPVQEPGTHTLGNVYGNVTITSSGVTLRDTVVAGNLYITTGVDLGDVLLENVTVLGEIVVSGGGLSEGGDDSIILRNVTAPTLVVDNIQDQKVSLRVEGNGVIDTASIRTNAVLTDNTADGYGIKLVEFDAEGEEEYTLDLAGNVKEVVNLTPESYVNVGAGEVDKLTVDEKATDSVLNIAPGATVGNLNLDVATTVTGDGDIVNLTVNASGSTVSMLPDQIVVRPGVEATIDGEVMDSVAAAESSADPRLQAGYPKITDLAPTSATVQFSTNKSGTVYWAVTAVTDGSATVDELINPPSYTTSIVKSGSVSISGSKEIKSAKISGLTSDGSYYLSAVFVDVRGDQSPLKVISFTTPDNTVPNFASGYPYLSQITNISAQATVMTTKTCRLYWAVLPKGAAAPTAADFKANAVTGNLGFGTMDVTKNTTYTISDVNNVPLEELESYDLYLWLTDIDGGQSSAVKKLSFTTVDKTPPYFLTEPTVNSVKSSSVGLYANLNETGTLYWVVVEQGEEYPKPLAGQSGTVDLASDTAKLQVSAGMNALKSGKVSMKEGTDVSFTVSGLEEEKAYDLYYVAQDKAGNFSATVKKLTIHTLDPNAPTVTQEFTKYNGTDTKTPLADTSVRLVFSEAVQTVATNTPLVDLYEKVTQAVAQGSAAEEAARDAMAAVLRESIYLYLIPSNSQPVQVEEATKDTDKNNDDWVIDYRYAEIKLEEGKTVITFPNGTGINLKSGATYQFEIQPECIADTSATKNVMGRTKLDKFSTVFAQVNLSNVDLSQITVEGGTTATVHAAWHLDPISADKVEDSIDWDMLIWSESNLSFNLYKKAANSSTWTKLNDQPVSINHSTTTQGFLGVSVANDLLREDGQAWPEYEQLNQLEECEYAMEFVSIDGQTDSKAWNGRVDIRVNIVAAGSMALRQISTAVNEQNWQDTVVNGEVDNIGLPDDFTIKVPFSDQSIPTFTSGYPMFTEGATDMTMELLLNRAGTIYYVVAPKGEIVTTDNQGNNYKDEENYIKLPEDGDASVTMPTFKQPQTMEILNPDTNYNTSPNVKYGNTECKASVVTVTVDGLLPKTDYIVYFVIQNTAQNYSDVMCYRFTTTDVITPYITLINQSPSVSFETSENSELYYALVAWDEMPDFLDVKFASTSYMDEKELADFQKSGLDQEMTILEALMTTVPQGSGNKGPSVFDIYANATIRDRVGKLIRRNQSSDAMTTVSAGSMNLGKEQATVKDFKDQMKESTMYYCLAVARNKDGVEDGFKVIGDVNIPDEIPPKLTVGGSSSQKVNGTWSGTLSLSFSENLYWLDEDRKTKKEVWTKKDVDATKAVGLMNVLGGTAASKLELTSAAASSPTSGFTFKYSDVREGDTLELFVTGYVSDSYMNGREKIILTYVTTEGGQDGFLSQGRFVITSGAMEGDSPVQE